MDAGGKVADEGLVKSKDLYAKREISIKGWADEARKRIEGNEKKDECPRCHRKLDISNTEEVEGKKTNSY